MGSVKVLEKQFCSLSVILGPQSALFFGGSPNASQDPGVTAVLFI